MTRIISRILLFGGLLGLLVGCGDVLPDGSGGASIAGTVSAPTGGDVAGTEVFACFGSDLDCAHLGSIVVSEGGSSARYQLDRLPRGSYSVYAHKDADGDGDSPESGDLWGYFGRNAGGPILVTPPNTEVNIEMILLTDPAQVANLAETLRRAVATTP